MGEELNLDEKVKKAAGNYGVTRAYRPLGSNRGIDLEVDKALFDEVREFVENLELPQGYSIKYSGNSIYIWKERKVLASLPKGIASLFASLIGTNSNAVFSVAEGYSAGGSKGYKVDLIDLSDPLVREFYYKIIGSEG